MIKSIFLGCNFVGFNHKLFGLNKDGEIIPMQLQDRQEVFRQLKYASQQQGDSTHGEYFHSLEMTTLLKRTLPIKKFGLWMVLGLSKCTSNFGMSIRRPLIFIILLNLPFFIILVVTESIPTLSFKLDLEWSSIVNTCNEFIKIINPFRTYNLTLGLLGTLSDLIIRIISSYCIYNFIRASRRFVK